MTCSPRFEGSFLKGWRTVNSVSLNALKRQFISYIDIYTIHIWYGIMVELLVSKGQFLLSKGQVQLQLIPHMCACHEKT